MGQISFLDKNKVLVASMFFLFDRCFQKASLLRSLFTSYSYTVTLLYNRQKHGVFRSPEHKVLRVSYCDRPMSGVLRLSSVNNFFKYLLLLNHSANLDETRQGCSLGEALQQMFKNLIPSITLVAMATKRKKCKIFENLL